MISRSNRLRLWFAMATVAFTLISLPLPTRAAEMRAFYVDSWHAGFMSAAEVTTLVNTCKTYNYNAVIVQMRRRGDAWYMPQSPNLEPRTTAISSGFDALAEVINQCHAASPSIQVYCWVPTMLIWSDSSAAPTQAGHVYNTHPEYLMKNYAGDTWISEGYYLDPGNPDAMQWNHNMALDIVGRYNVDGFSWDYIRYPEQDAGYNSVALSRYNTEFGLSGKPSTTDSNFSDWRRRQVTDFVRWTDSELLALKPNLVISASVFASRSDAYTARFQDWKTWNSEGIIDICLPMNYSSTNSTYNSRCDDIYANQGIRYAYIGQGAYLNTKANTVTQLAYARSKGFYGTALYSYAVPNSGTVDKTGTLSYIKTNFQPTYTSAPTLPWKSSPTKGIVKGTITRSDTGAALYNATVSINTGTGRSIRTEPHGKYAFFEVAAGTYTITVNATGMDPKTGSVTVTAGQVVNLNLAASPSTGGSGDIIIDNTAAALTGSWTLATSATDKYGADYRYKGPGTGTAYVTFTPTITTAGSYSVSEWHSVGSNRTTAAPHVVTYSGGSSTVNVNQQLSGGAWNVLGTYSFATGTAGNVKITDNFTGSSYVAIADAVKFTLTASADIVVDNSDSGFTASANWSAGTSATDKYGADYRFHNTGTVVDAAQWNFTLGATGNYEAYAWWSQGSNRAAAAPYIVYYAGGSSTVYKNQQANGGAWQSLGTFNMNSGANKVQLSAYATTGYVAIADAIKIVAR